MIGETFEMPFIAISTNLIQLVPEDFLKVFFLLKKDFQNTLPGSELQTCNSDIQDNVEIAPNVRLLRHLCRGENKYKNVLGDLGRCDRRG